MSRLLTPEQINPKDLPSYCSITKVYTTPHAFSAVSQPHSWCSAGPVRCTARGRISSVWGRAPQTPSLAGSGNRVASRGAALQGNAPGIRHLHPITGHLKYQYVEGSSFSLLLWRGRGRTDSSLADQAAWGRLGKGQGLSQGGQLSTTHGGLWKRLCTLKALDVRTYCWIPYSQAYSSME